MSDVITISDAEYTKALEKLPAFQNTFAELVKFVSRGGPGFDLEFRDADYYKRECDPGYQMIGGGVITRDDFRGGEFFTIDMQLKRDTQHEAEYRVSFLVMDGDGGHYHNQAGTLATQHRFYVPLATAEEVQTWRVDPSVSGKRQDLSWRLENWKPYPFSRSVDYGKSISSIVALMHDVMDIMMFEYLRRDAQMLFNMEAQEGMAVSKRLKDLNKEIGEHSASPSSPTQTPQPPRRRFFGLFGDPK